MPASRSARATTLAPRSCPSRPGLATTTRMRPGAVTRVPPSGFEQTVREYAAVESPPDWRTDLLAGATRVEVPVVARNPAAWPGYEPRAAVTVWRLPRGPVAAVWDFRVQGGSFGEDDATALAAAAALAVEAGRPLLTLVRS